MNETIKNKDNNVFFSKLYNTLFINVLYIGYNAIHFYKTNITAVYLF